MRRILLLISAGLVASAHTGPRPFDDAEFRRFMGMAAIFERELYHCDDRASHIQECYPELGAFNVEKWKKVYAAGHAMFGQ